MTLPLQLAIGLVCSALIGLVAYRRGSLTRSGGLGAVIVGTAIFGLGGLIPGLLLIAFFVTSSLLSHYHETQKESIAEKFAKGHQRDIGQALANGGAGALLAGASAVIPDPIVLAAFVGALATVNADTWATELGVLHPSPPRLITTWQPVEPGTSGGVSLTGLFAKTGGALLIGGLAAGLLAAGTLFGGPSAYPVWKLIPAGLIGGLVGSYFDSLLGATIQAIYICPSCQKETEKHPVHTCGAATAIRRGWRWLNNDLVNFTSSLLGAGVAAGVWAILA